MTTRLTDLYGEIRPEDVLPAGLPETREAVARHAGARPEEVVVTSGANLGLACVLTWARVRLPGRPVLCPRPHFPAYPSQALLQGLAVRYYNLAEDRGWQPDVEELARAVRRESPAVVIWNQPHNPTGAVLARAALERLIDEAASVGAVVVQDEVFADLVYEGEPPGPPPPAPHLVRVGGFNKRFPVLADRRIAYILAGKSLAAELALVHRTLAIGASVTDQRAAAALLADDPEWQLGRLRQELREQRDLALACLRGCPGLHAPAPAAGLFLWLRLPSGMDARQFSAGLRSRSGLWCAAGPSFGVSEQPWVRLRFAVPLRLLEPHCAAFRDFLQECLDRPSAGPSLAGPVATH